MPDVTEQLRRYGEAVEEVAISGSRKPDELGGQPRSRRWRWPAAAAAVLLVGIAAALVVSWGDDLGDAGVEVDTAGETGGSSLDSSTDVVPSQEVDERGAAPESGGAIGGVLPNGTAYEIDSASLSSTVVGLSAGIVVDAPDGPRAIGIVSFFRSGGDEDPIINESSGIVVVPSGDWSMRVTIYDDVRPLLGADPIANVESWIQPAAIDTPSLLPAYELAAPLRWATDDELPLQMQVMYPQFVVRRGCGDLARACSDEGTVQVVAAEDVSTPAPSWPGGDVRITSR